MASPSPSVALLVARNALKVLAWVRQRPYALPPRVWYGIVVASAVAAALLAGFGVGPWWLPLAALAPAGLAAGPSAAWLAAWRARDRPVVFIARFVDENPEHSSIAAVHLKQVERRLRRNDVLLAAFDVRYIKAPVKESHARRLLRWTTVTAVVSGSGLLVDSHARWEGWMLLRWPQTEGWFSGEEFGFLNDLRHRPSAVERSVTRSDTEFPARKMTTDVFPAEHVRSVEATLLVLASAFAASDEREERALKDADAMREVLPVQARAVLEIGKALSLLRASDDIVAAARQLEAAGDAGADHIYLWNSCAALWTQAEQRDLSAGNDRVRVATRGLAVAPDDFFAQVAAAYGSMAAGHPADAVPRFESAVNNDEVLDEQIIRDDLAVAYWQSGETEKAREEARRNYLQWPRSMRRHILKAARVTEEEYLRDPCARWSEERGDASALSEAELAAVERAVQAVVQRDRAELEEMAAYEVEDGDPYVWAHGYEADGSAVHAPPGPASDWELSCSRTADGACAVDIWLWIGGEGPSPLALQLELLADESTGVSVKFVALQPL